jgi:hypothetical protein
MDEVNEINEVKAKPKCFDSKAYYKEYYAKNREKMKLRAKLYYQKNKHKKQATMKKYYENNKEKLSEYHRNYQKEYRLKIKKEKNVLTF